MSTAPAAPSTTAKVKEWQPPQSVGNFDAMYPTHRHRLVDKGQNRRGDRLSYWLERGYEIAPYGNEGMKKNRSTGATAQDHAVHFRGLVLMRCPVDLAEARNKYYREKNARLMEAGQRMRDLREESAAANAKSRKAVTSAFAEAHIRKGNQVLEDSKADTDRPGQNRSLRDVDPAAIEELTRRMNEMKTAQEALAAENQRLREEAAERSKRPSDRKRRSFPVS